MIDTLLPWAPLVLTVLTILVGLLVMFRAPLHSERDLIFDKKQPTAVPALIGLAVTLALALGVLSGVRAMS